MDQGSGEQSAIQRLAIRVGLYVGVFLAGGLFAFLYSYLPLHSAKDWKIDYLEERIAAKDQQLETVSAELASLEVDTADRPDGDTFKLLQDELASADKDVANLERKLEKLERRNKELEKSRNQWKARHAEAEKKAKTTRVAATAAPTQPPAAPAPGAASGGIEVAVGKRWRSPDGQSDFDLVAIDGGRARVVPNASRLTPGTVPKTRDVGPGGSFEVTDAAGRSRRVTVERVDGQKGITIQVD